MRVALLLCLAISATVVGAPIGETRYRLEAVRAYDKSSTSISADGEHLIRLGDIFQRIAVRPYEQQRFELLEIGLPMSRAVDAIRYAGALRVLEEEGTLWTPEGDARVRLLDDDFADWYSIARAGDFLVCGGSGWRFATLRPEPGGDLELIEAEGVGASTARMMAGDRHGGFYYAFTSTIYGAQVDSSGQIVIGGTYESDDTRALESSPGLDHVYSAQDGGLVLYEVEAPGQLLRVASLIQRGRIAVDLDVSFDAERRVDRVAIAYHDTIYAFDVDEHGDFTLLLAEGETTYGPRCCFLGPDRLYYTNGRDRAWVRDGPALDRRRGIELFQSGVADLSVAPDGEGWAEINADVVSYGAATAKGFAAPGSQREGRFRDHIAINDTHIYTGFWENWIQRFYIFERSAPPALVDSLDVEFGPGSTVPWSIEREFLVTRDVVLDLSDPASPMPVGRLLGPTDYHYGPYDLATRPFPGSETDVLVGAFVGRGFPEDTLAFYRVSHERGVERISHDQVDWGFQLTFDDTRDLLYRTHWLAVEDPIWVYDISDPYLPVRLHRHLFDEQNSATRTIRDGIVCLDGILHVFDSKLYGLNWNIRATPLWFDGDRFVPLGESLHASIRPLRPSGQGGYLTTRGQTDGAALLTFDPPPRPRREECCWDGPPPR